MFGKFRQVSNDAPPLPHSFCFPPTQTNVSASFLPPFSLKQKRRCRRYRAICRSEFHKGQIRQWQRIRQLPFPKLSFFSVSFPLIKMQFPTPRTESAKLGGSFLSNPLPSRHTFIGTIIPCHRCHILGPSPVPVLNPMLRQLLQLPPILRRNAAVVS